MRGTDSSASLHWVSLLLTSTWVPDVMFLAQSQHCLSCIEFCILFFSPIISHVEGFPLPPHIFLNTKAASARLSSSET